MHKNNITLSIRMDEELFNRLETMAHEAGLSKSEMARRILSESSGIIICNAPQIAANLFKIGQLLERDDLAEVTKQEIWQSCHLLKMEIKRLVEKGGDLCGDSEGN